MKEIPVTLVKANQLMLVILTLLSIFLQNVWIVLGTLVLVAASLLFGPKANLAMRIAKIFIKDFSKDETEAVVLLRFNQTIAASLLAIATTILFVSGHWIAWVFTGMVSIAAAVALSGFCVGCFMYYQIKRLSYKMRHNN
ncbi:DUF4395 domain-containing protein [Bacillus tamaricis]|uniref:DUF4395 domain-containing protein n=2 Tax=Evansella tamaricis TaxID=2069301 RepID=A0ABS6JIF7_9BACI|nr:DUF4395 domain-containing protein [Evansella tamaricis]